MQEALSGKYGTPSSKTTVEYQNSYAAKFIGTVVTWENTLSKMTLTQYNGSKDFSGLVIEHKALAAQVVMEPKQPSKDL